MVWMKKSFFLLKCLLKLPTFDLLYYAMSFYNKDNEYLLTKIFLSKGRMDRRPVVFTTISTLFFTHSHCTILLYVSANQNLYQEFFFLSCHIAFILDFSNDLHFNLFH